MVLFVGTKFLSQHLAILAIHAMAAVSGATSSLVYSLFTVLLVVIEHNHCSKVHSLHPLSKILWFSLMSYWF